MSNVSLMTVPCFNRKSHLRLRITPHSATTAVSATFSTSFLRSYGPSSSPLSPELNPLIARFRVTQQQEYELQVGKTEEIKQRLMKFGKAVIQHLREETQFLFRLLAMALCLSVCLSVRLSVTSRSSTKTAKRIGSQNTTTRYPRDSSFLTPKISAKFDRGHPYEGTKCRWGGSKSATFDK